MKVIARMSATKKSRAFEQGQIKKLIRMTQPLVMRLPPPASVRNHVACALARRSLSSAAGAHIRSRAAQRRADKVALQKALRRRDWEA